MGLRAKLLTGYGVFIAALVLLGAWSAWRLHDMGKVSRRIISENYDSVVAAQEMKESLERQDSAALFLLIGAREKSLNQLRAACEHLLQLNQRAMVAKAEAAAGVAQLWFYRTLLIAGVLVAAGLGLAFLLAKQIVEPLRQLTESTARIAGGDLNAKVPVNSRDEVGLLAAEYNRMAECIRQLRSSDMGKLLVAQQTTEAAIDSLYDPVIVTDAEGCVTKLNPAAEEIFGFETENAGKHVGEVARDQRIAGAVAEALESQQPVASEGMSAVLPLAVDGLERSFRLRTTPMRDHGKSLLGAVTLLEDITHAPRRRVRIAVRTIDRLGQSAGCLRRFRGGGYGEIERQVGMLADVERIAVVQEGRDRHQRAVPS